MESVCLEWGILERHQDWEYIDKSVHTALMGKANAANQAAQATAKAKAQAKAKPGKGYKGKGKRKDREQGGESGRVAGGIKSRSYRRSATYWKLKCNRLEEEVKRLTKLLNDKTCYTRETLRTRRKKYLRESLKGQWIAPFSGYKFAVKRNRGHCSFETLRDHLEIVHVRQSIARWEILLHANLNCMARNFYAKGYDYFGQLLEFDWSWLDLIHDSFHFFTWEINTIRSDSTHTADTQGSHAQVTEITTCFQPIVCTISDLVEDSGDIHILYEEHPDFGIFLENTLQQPPQNLTFVFFCDLQKVPEAGVSIYIINIINMNMYLFVDPHSC